MTQLGPVLWLQPHSEHFVGSISVNESGIAHRLLAVLNTCHDRIDIYHAKIELNWNRYQLYSLLKRQTPHHCTCLRSRPSPSTVPELRICTTLSVLLHEVLEAHLAEVGLVPVIKVLSLLDNILGIFGLRALLGLDLGPVPLVLRFCPGSLLLNIDIHGCLTSRRINGGQVFHCIVIALLARAADGVDGVAVFDSGFLRDQAV